MATIDTQNPDPNCGWRKKLAVFVPEANSLGALAVIRSLGRAGYRVYTASSNASALGLLSTYAERAEVCPAYSDDSYKDWLLNFLETHSIAAIVPSEGFLLAIRPFFGRLKHLMPLAQDETPVYAALSKNDVHEKLMDARADAHLPPSIVIADGRSFPSDEDLARLGLPLFLKVDAVHSREGKGGKVIKANTVAEAQAALRECTTKYRKVLIQGFVPGKGIGVFFILWKSDVLAEFMHRRVHEVPHTGGVSSFRESYSLASVRDDALSKIKALGWHGVAMLEYRYDEVTQQFFFVELNARFWGSLHLALCSGVDFPTLLLDVFFGHPNPPVTSFPRGVRCRNTFPAEMQYVFSCVRDCRLPWQKRIYPIFEFVQLSLNYKVFNDLWFKNDTAIYFVALRRSITLLSSALRRRLRTRFS